MPELSETLIDELNDKKLIYDARIFFQHVLLLVFQHVLLNGAINSYPSVTLRASPILEKTFLKNCCLVMAIVKYDLLELSQI